MRFKRWTLLLVPVVCAVGLWCSSMPVNSWSGARWVNLPVLVVDGASGRPIPGAEIEIVHPYDDERRPVQGRTEADGRAVLRNLFYASGTESLVGGTEHVTFSPFVIRVAAGGYSEFCADLASTRDEPYPYEKATAPPLNLRYPVAGPVKISLTRSGGDAPGPDRR